ncbi:putative chromosome region maintenance protein 5/exportin [Schistosoma mansoni]|uniref:putative chromosome region maintenance protein 5/exportin n=1 Tax=Schistosoma mansoni TaxID=6183 RepID=UPI0001A633A6|nr:putative chromosome region maintenance protein 5/exportin [Schistosoma mansoni]|eukprot:XP_018648511.1 putative chromosome region maintenance protein 5/exportin [Schistosoma mansoni]
MDRNSLLMAVSSLLDPTIDNNKRSECFMMAENYKNEQFQFADVDFLCNANQPSVIILFGLQCLDHYLKNHWGQMAFHAKSSLKQNIFKLSREINNFRFSREEMRAFSLMLSQIIVFLIKCEWPQQWPTMLPEFLSLGKIGILQTKLVLNSFLRLYEDVVQFQDAPLSRRRDILTGLNDNLTEIFVFALDSIVNILLLPNADSSIDCDSLEICRESLYTLGGFLESCRLNVLTSWTPSEIAIRNLNLSRTLPFLSLITTLVGIRSLQTDALSLINILLSRRIQPGSEIPDSYGPTIADSFLKEPLGSSSPCNNLIKVLCSTLSENPEYSDERYNFLRLFGDIVVHIGCHMIIHWKAYSYESALCSCLDHGVCECPNLPSHLFQAILRLTAYPIHVISACTNKFWITVLRSEEESLLELTERFADDLFSIWQKNSLKVGQPSGTGIQSEWNRRIFETDDHTSFFSRYRSDLVKCLSAGASCWPQKFLPLCISWIETLIQASPSCQDYDQVTKFLLATSPLILEWEALDSFLEPCLSAVEQSLKTRHIDMDVSSKVKILIHGILQSSNTMDPLIRAKHLTCLSMLLQHVDPNNDSELLVPFLNKIFESLNSCPVVDESTSLIDTLDFVNRPRQVKTMHLASATSFLRFTRAHPIRMMPYFDKILNEINRLWMEKICGSMEKGILLEALVILGFRVPQPINVQFDFLRSLLVNVYGPWCGQNPYNVTPLSELLRACESGASGLVAVLGLNKPSDQLGNFESPYVQTRINLNHNVRSLLAVCRRLAEPCNNQQLENISLPILEPVLSPVLHVLRAFNELWLPETLKLVHPTLLPVLQHTDEIQLCSLNSQFQNILKFVDVTSPSLHRLRTFLNDCHENLMGIVGLLFVSLGSKFYRLPTEQLRIALHDGCCAAFEHLPDLKLNSLLRSILRPFIRQCPRQHFETAIIPLVPPIIEAAIKRTGARWNELVVADGRICEDEKAIAAELVLDRSTRLLSRTCLDILRLIYTFNGYEISEQFNTPKEHDGECDDDNDDVDMSESICANGQSGTNSSLGHLTKLLANMHTVSSEPDYNAQNLPSDPLFLRSLTKILAWPDTSICSKAAQWISILVEMLTNTVTQTNCGPKIATTHLSTDIAEFILFGILCGLHVNGKNAENALNCLLYAGIKTYLSVDIIVARQNLRSVIIRVLMDTLNGDKTKEGQIQQQLQIFEEKMFGNQDRPATMRVRRDAFKKIVDPIIGVPLSQRFRNEFQIHNIPPLHRPKWIRIREKRDTSHIENDFGLTNLFANTTN